MFMCTCLSKRKEGISKSILVFFLVANPLLSPAQTQLAPGDVALLSYSADTSPISRYFDFVLLTDIAVGTPINFTDAGYFSGSLNTLNESMIRFIADTPLDAGTIIHWNSSINDSRFYKDPDDEFSGAFTLAGGGDSLIVYQGQADNPTFLFALNNTDNEASDSQFALGNLSSGDSQLPNGLQLGTNALGTNASTSNGGRHQDNAAYIGPIISGTKKELLLAISAVDNWAFDNSQSIISAQLHSSIVVVADNNNNNNNNLLSIENNNPANEILLTPNPVRDMLTITTAATHHLRTATIFDSHGKRSYQQKLDGNGLTNKINTSAIPTGLYFITLHTQNDTVTKRLWIQ